MSIKTPSLTQSFVSVCLLSLASQYSLADFDFRPGIVGGKIVTSGHDDDAGIEIADLRVSSYAFGENADDPYAVGDPGFNTEGASAFAAGSTLRLSSLPIDGLFLRYWDGTGTPAFGATPAAEGIRLAATFTQYVVATTGAATYSPTSATSLLVGSFAANGGMHAHLGSALLPDAAGTATPPDGAYLVSFRLSNPGTGVADSSPLFVVFNNGLSETTNDAAVAYVNAQYAAVPEPAMLSVIVVAGGTLLRRRRT